MSKRILRDYGLTIVLACMFLVSWALHGAGEYWQEQYPHAQIPWYVTYFTTTFENWQSEFLQVLVLVELTTVLRRKGSPESKEVE